MACIAHAMFTSLCVIIIHSYDPGYDRYWSVCWPAIRRLNKWPQKKRLPIETGETHENHAQKLWNPSVSFFMVNMASGIARGRVLSPTTTTAVVSHQYGDVSHASLLNIRSHKGSHQLNDIGYSCQLTAVKTRNPLTSVTWPHRGLRCSLWGWVLDDGVAQDGAQGK